MTTFPNFYGLKHENASYFLDDLEMALLTFGRDEDNVKVRAFSLVLRDAAKLWFQGLPAATKTNWDTLKEAFLEKYVTDNTPEKLWQKLCDLQQDHSGSYLAYEARFLKLWAEWETSLPAGERAPNVIQQERFVAGLFFVLQEKVSSKFLKSFDEAK